MRLLSIILGSASLALLTSNAWSQDQLEEYKKFINAGIGVGLNRSEFNIRHGGQFTTMMYSDKRDVVPVTHVGSAAKPIFSTFRYLRWSYDASMQKFEANRQLVSQQVMDGPVNLSTDNDNQLDLGTSIKGTIFTAMPTLKLYFEPLPWFHFDVGYGVGLGLAKVSGSYYENLGESTPPACRNATTVAAITATCEKHDVDYKKVSYSEVFSLGATVKFIALRYSRGGPRYKEGSRRSSVFSEGISIFLELDL